ncbi:MAG: hypothetical protein KF898_07160 [Parachlamydiales bacterium]|nr:hypothetical protein [Candidatus Acheromyda pituitae]
MSHRSSSLRQLQNSFALQNRPFEAADALEGPADLLSEEQVKLPWLRTGGQLCCRL